MMKTTDARDRNSSKISNKENINTYKRGSTTFCARLASSDIATANAREKVVIREIVLCCNVAIPKP
jgi:hypothetical protein